MTRPNAARVVLVALLGSMLVACLVAPASAGLEYSIYQWWTDQAKTSDGAAPVHPDWGATYGPMGLNWTTADIWGQYVDLQTWTIPTPAVPGYAEIKYEYAGNAGINTFGWYVQGNSGTKHQIMSGPDDWLTPEKTITFVPPASAGDQIGFYLGAAGKTLYTEKALNAAVSGAQQRWVKIFNDPRGTKYGWIMAWEDKNKPTENPFTAGSLSTTSPVEADFNDMIVTFRWQPTPELSTILLLGLSLVAVPVVCRKRRS